MNDYLRSPREVAAAVGQRAKDLRLARGIPQSDLARAANVSPSTLGRFERDGTIGFDAVVRIAFALGEEMSLDGLFPAYDPRTLDDVLRRSRKPQRARKKS